MHQLNIKQQGQGPLHIILIHGLFGSLDNLANIARSLSEQYTVTNIDVRNHGLSFQENNMAYPALAQDIINLMDELTIDRAHILGHSMGGKIAMQTALNFPERINKLVVADIAPVAYPNRHQSIIDGLKAINLNDLASRQQADDILANYVETKSIRQFLLRNLATNEQGFYFKCHLNNIAHCYHQIIAGVDATTPFNGATLFIKGGRSDYIEAQHQALIKRLFPHSQAKIILDAGHWLHAEKPVAFNKIVKNFLTL